MGNIWEIIWDNLVDIYIGEQWDKKIYTEKGRYGIASFRSLIFHNVWEYFGIAQLYKLNDVGYFTLFSDMNMGMRTRVGYFMGYIYIYIYISIHIDMYISK